MPTASGTAYVLQNGDIHNVVINLQGLKETKGNGPIRFGTTEKWEANQLRDASC